MDFWGRIATMDKLIIIKLGGSLITDKEKPLTAREQVIKRLGKEILQASKKYKGKIIIGHGSGSFGHAFAAKYQTYKGLINKKSLEGVVRVSDVAIALNRIVIKNLLKAGLNAVSFSPGSFAVSKSQKPDKYLLDALEEALKIGIIPLVYGDVVFDKRQGFTIFSTEKIIGILVKRLSKKYKIERIIYAGVTDGVYDSNKKTIGKITPANFAEIKKAIGGSNATDVTGGMIHKVGESLKLVERYKSEIFIVNGGRLGVLKNALLGNIVLGTMISSPIRRFQKGGRNPS